MTGALEQEALAARLKEITERSQRVAAEFAARHGADAASPDPDPLGIGKAFLDMTARMMADPARLATAQAELARQYAQLWQDTAERMMGAAQPAPVIEPEPGDRRFRDDAWRENFVFDFIKQSYLLSSRFLLGGVAEAEGGDPHDAEKVAFYTRQFVDAMAPTNFAATNPKVLRETIDSKGENLLRGFENLLRDLEAGKGRLRIAQTDMSAFEVGRNVAVTPGKVVLRTELMELIQYAPTTETVHETPLLIVPPWINKFYILDLAPENSFVRWAVEQGHTVFVISWVNPDARLSDKAFEDYMAEGPLAALDAIERITGARSANAIGYCLGGTLLAVTLAWLAARGETPIRSATYFASLVDFSEVGELGVFIDEAQVGALEERMDKAGGYLEGADMATTFNMLRANDLIWSFVINNYLLGRDPVPFDLLFWNADSTRMPKRMHSFYLRRMYLENALATPGALEVAGERLDLGAIKTRSYVVGTREDHIAPWRGVYLGARHYGGPVRFVLAASGHIAGIVNPPAAGKYSHWTHSRMLKTSEAWLERAAEKPGSWWPDWAAWIARTTGGEVPARIPGAGPLPALADAPGGYVAERS